MNPVKAVVATTAGHSRITINYAEVAGSYYRDGIGEWISGVDSIDNDIVRISHIYQVRTEAARA